MVSSHSCRLCSTVDLQIERRAQYNNMTMCERACRPSACRHMYVYCQAAPLGQSCLLSSTPASLQVCRVRLTKQDEQARVPRSLVGPENGRRRITVCFVHTSKVAEGLHLVKNCACFVADCSIAVHIRWQKSLLLDHLSSEKGKILQRRPPPRPVL